MGAVVVVRVAAVEEPVTVEEVATKQEAVAAAVVEVEVVVGRTVGRVVAIVPDQS